MGRRYLKDNEVAVSFERWGQIEAALKESGWSHDNAATPLRYYRSADRNVCELRDSSIPKYQAESDARNRVHEFAGRVIEALELHDQYPIRGSEQFIADVETVIAANEAEAARNRIRPNNNN